MQGVTVLLNAQGASVVLADLPSSTGPDTAHEMGKNVTFVAADVSLVLAWRAKMWGVASCDVVM